MATQKSIDDQFDAVQKKVPTKKVEKSTGKTARQIIASSRSAPRQASIYDKAPFKQLRKLAKMRRVPRWNSRPRLGLIAYLAKEDVRGKYRGGVDPKWKPGHTV